MTAYKAHDERLPTVLRDRPTAEDAPALSIRALHKTYDKSGLAVDDLSLDIEKGEVLSLLGPSGCGKTTTLRAIAGLERPESGEVRIGDRVVFSTLGKRTVSLPPERRNLSMVFQQYALWPHMNVLGNVVFGLRMRGMQRSEAQRVAEDALRRVRLYDERHRNIGQLSGGQQQRVALARATAGNPSVILFDEPLSNLDARLRQEMRIELLELQKSLGFTAFYVTHDQEEAFSISDRIAVMNKGRIEQISRPEDLWDQPATAFVAEFIGSTNRLVGQVSAPARTEGFTLDVAGSDMHLAVATDEHVDPGLPIRAYVKIGDVQLSEERPSDRENLWEGTVALESYEGETATVKVDVGPVSIVSRQTGWERRGERRVFVHIPPSAVRFFPDLERQPSTQS